MVKTQVHNVIILDRSGSMSSIRQAAVDSFNETLAGIRKAQQKFADTQEHFISLVTFCSCEMRNVLDKTPICEAHPLRLKDYEPCCCTPLYDAMGFTFTNICKYVKPLKDAVVVVTIITDGMENASREYTGSSIKRFVETLRTEGWTFTYMGANQNSVEAAMEMAIHNTRNFAYSEEGINACMRKDANTRMNFFSRLAQMKKKEGLRCYSLSTEALHSHYTMLFDEAFEEEESKEE
ncbi:hypothetical protein [Parabacteroides sp.]